MKPYFAMKKDTLKKTKRNPKFEDIMSTIDTGSSISRHLQRIEERKQDFKIQRDEIFRRLKVKKFVELILKAAENNAVLSNKSNYPETDMKTNDNNLNDLNNLHDGNEDSMENTFDKNPYLLLDSRLPEEYESCHIITAKNYPITMLSRSVNYETEEMLAYKNKHGNIIIIYDGDETIAPKTARTLVERGYDNIYMLSGGLRVCWKQFPKGLIIGKLPMALQSSLLKSVRPAHNSLSMYNNSNVQRKNPDGDSTRTNSGLNLLRSKSRLNDVLSVVSTRSVNRVSRSTFKSSDFDTYCDIGSRQKGRTCEEEFTMEDLGYLSLTLDDMDSCTNNSVCSRILSTRG